ncbi:glycoside hydrolase family 3 protein [Baudoinia panamericana UAMH 10762]|uniref:beta-glucosidase n=1 Tax=Baudoinia panamericana (strain UAMH 10762) TaxID=717646 RepID=M2LDK6_BAUPA|nr:glycoside hydrolase family 3 protein [Baudoinia panamericana UAMH 10762]EMC92062.1 glycoside hydrolase family 3 protein [Baudoinia panamericana UAMH 10762]
MLNHCREGNAADPYLTGALVAPTVQGMQESVIACTKHYILNEQETNRYIAFANPSAATLSSNADDKTIHEVYLWPFHEAVNAGTGSIMCSYNRLNSTYACQDDRTLNQLLKGEVGFRGFVVSDWGAQTSGLASAIGGLDMAMPTSRYWINNTLAIAARNGSFSQARLQDMATRIIAAWYAAGDNTPSEPMMGVGMITNLTRPHTNCDVRDPASAPSILQQAQEGHVLVKNVNNALPLKRPKVISLFGYDALPQALFTTDSVSTPIGANDLFQLNLANLPNGTAFVQGFFNGVPFLPYINGTLITGGGSGSNTPPYTSTVSLSSTRYWTVDGAADYGDPHSHMTPSPAERSRRGHSSFGISEARTQVSSAPVTPVSSSSTPLRAKVGIARA